RERLPQLDELADREDSAVGHGDQVARAACRTIDRGPGLSVELAEARWQGVGQCQDVAGGGLLVARRRHVESRTNCGPGEAVPRCDALCGCAAGGAKLAADQQRAVVSQPEASNGTIDPEAEGHVGRAVP